MTTPLFRDDAYLRDCTAHVCEVTPGGSVVLDQTVFYPKGGGQPGDTGTIRWAGGEIAVTDTLKGDAGAILHVAPAGAALPAPGDEVEAILDWERRHGHMRIHTGLHLLSVVIPLPVTGGSIGAEKGRLDFDMPESPEDKAALEARLNEIVAADHPVTSEWITDAELEANPQMVKTMSVKPPIGEGHVRLVRIGAGEAPVDLQPCGGTHVRSTAEIGRLTLGKIEKKGKQNRRVSISLV